MIAGSQDEVDFFFDAVCLFAVESNLIASLIKPSVTLCHGEVAAGRFVVEGNGILDLSNRIGGCRPTE